jgi:hypothetical protein
MSAVAFLIWSLIAAFAGLLVVSLYRVLQDANRDRGMLSESRGRPIAPERVQAPIIMCPQQRTTDSGKHMDLNQAVRKGGVRSLSSCPINRSTKGKKAWEALKDYIVPVSEVEERAELDFFEALPAREQRRLEIKRSVMWPVRKACPKADS